MKIWIVEVCQCDEYGTMGFWGAFSSEEAAHEAAKKAGLQNIDEGEEWAWCTDYYEVSEYEVK